ncbi:hypothetical protein [Halobacteriovorax sp.]|uniref:hypothetical protein n=1 Tax=Halobacteriovorax sp. TaxID=2020862 RepID=UPI0035698173
MRKLNLLLFFTLYLLSQPAFSTKNALMLLATGQEQKAINLLEYQFNQEESKSKQGEIAYLLSLNPEYKTQRSATYYIQNTLENYKDLDTVNKARLIRTLADKSFETGNLERALENYNKSLGLKENSKLSDYLTLQKTWVLVNLNQQEKALKFLYQYITTKKSHIIDSMVYDFGRLFVEYLQLPKNQELALDLKNIIQKDSLIEGFYTGLSRTKLPPEKIIPQMKTFNLYKEFYKIGIQSKRISSHSNCSILSWEIPTNSSMELINAISRELIKCNYTNKSKIIPTYQTLVKEGTPSKDLALLSTIVGDTKESCRLYSSLLELDYDKESFSYLLNNCLKKDINTHIIKNIRTSSNKEFIKKVLKKDSYAKHILEELLPQESDSIQFLELVFTELKIKRGVINKELLTLNKSNFKMNSPVYCLFYSSECNEEESLETFKHLNTSQKILFTRVLTQEKKFNYIRTILTKNSDLLKNSFIASEVYKNAKEFPGLYKDNFFKLLVNKKISQNSNISKKSRKNLKKLLGKSWAKTIDISTQLIKTLQYLKNLKTVQRQEYAFRKISIIRTVMANQKWPSIDVRDVIIDGYQQTLKDMRVSLAKHTTDITPLIDSKLKIWQENI